MDIAADKPLAERIEEAAKLAGSRNEARFISQFYANVPLPDLAQRSAVELHAAGAELFEHARTRRGRAPKIRVYTPRQRFDDGRALHSVVEIVNDDMPFLVDSVIAALNREALTVHLVIHPVVTVKRDKNGRLSRVLQSGASAAGCSRESWMRIEIDQHTDRARLASIKRALKRVLADARAAVEDWKPMLDRVRSIKDELIAAPPDLPADDMGETVDFLDWLADDHFTFLGYRAYRIVGSGESAKMSVVPKSGLGILRDPDIHVFEGLREMSALPEDVRAFLDAPHLLIINKANQRSTVHRPVHLDAIGVKLFDKDRRVIGEQLFVGLFTSTVYTEGANSIPLLRRKIRRILERAEFPPQGHDYKALEHILLTYPRDELFQIDDDQLYRISLGILHLQERQRVALFTRHDAFHRFVSCLVFVPRDRYTTAIRTAFSHILQQDFGGELVAYYTQVSDESVLARLQFILKVDPAARRESDTAAIEARLAEAARGWSDTLREDLVRKHGEEAGLTLFTKYENAFSVGYCADFDCTQAVADIDRIEAALDSGDLQLGMYRPPGLPDESFRFRIYNRGTEVPLSDALPMLEHMGLRVIDERPYPVLPQGGESVWLHDFGVVARDRTATDPLDRRGAFEEAFGRVWTGEMDDDGFNALVLSAGLSWREVTIIRACAAYLRQAGMAFSQRYVERTLSRNPRLARLVVDLFLARAGGAKARRLTDLRRRIDSGLDQVASLDEDRILRRFANVVECTLRTNYHQTRPDGAPKPYLSFKLDSQSLIALPRPRPMVEIWVYAPTVEGVHLRFGKVARGGLRWSDRREDFRTEVLGLAKAQVVKNAVIVPVGSKGGFVVKRPPADQSREAQVAEGIECYKTFIRGMLDLTDNIEAGSIVPPKDVERYDDDDPYLVVAADKGTATFSDIANEVSAEFGFWLGDAFASGGSDGYDHKEIGITARGAWEAVKRHFREIGTDIQKEDFTVVGVGDMGGDVFGNGMLLSRHIKLVAAFNHRHIFIDPDPDPAASFRERRRLYNAGAGWDAYDSSVISKGGGVFERSAKWVTLTAPVRKMLGVDRDRATPNELIRLLLQQPVDLLWFGGIGTFVKSEDESDFEVGDRANDPIRVDGAELRAKVVGEGANLGMTQLGRIEYALAGGRLNTDAIDNSAGVDTSDHEVNIKILLAEAVALDRLTLNRRNRLLDDMTEDVAALVLRDNYLQTACLSVSQKIGARGAWRFSRFMRALEREGRLDRMVEELPDDEEIDIRLARDEGYTRPELAVLLSYAKIALYEELLESDLPDEPQLVDDLVRYFPDPLHRRYRKEIERHRLRREIIATLATNSTVNRAGVTLVHDLTEETGMDPDDVVRAYIACRDSLDLRDLWAGVEALDNVVPAAIQIGVLHDTGRLIRATTRWFLQNAERPIDIAATVKRIGPGLRAFRSGLARMLGEDLRAEFSRRQSEAEADGLPGELARNVAEQAYLLSGCDVVTLAAADDAPLREVGTVYFAIGDAFNLAWLRDAASAMTAEHYWDRRASEAVVQDLYRHQLALTRRALVRGAKTPADVEGWLGGQTGDVGRVLRLLKEICSAGVPELEMLTVATHQLAEIATD